MDATIELIERLTAIPGPSGYEDAVVIAIREQLEGLPGTIEVDAIGNLVLRLPAESGAPSLLLAAHTDEVGLLVGSVADDGMVYCVRNGFIDERTLLASRIEIWTDTGPVLGVIGSKSRHQVDASDLARAIEVEDLWIDVGAGSAAEAERLGIRIGQPATTVSPLARLGDGLLTGKAIDNRAGCAVLIEVARAVAERPRDYELVFAWAAQEEVGSRGARVLSHWLTPTAAVVVDTMPAGDRSTPAHRATSAVGAGPVIRAQDTRGTAGTLYSPQVRRQLERVARSLGIPFQVDCYPTWTDACEIHLAGRGVATGGVFLPRRCSHSASEVIATADIQRAIELLVGFTDLDAAAVRDLATRPALPLGRQA
jgi:putative aminopeptidase FrvX